MTPAKRLKRSIAYHAQNAIIEIERGMDLIKPEITKNRSTYRLESREAAKIHKLLKDSLACIKKVMVRL